MVRSSPLNGGKHYGTSISQLRYDHGRHQSNNIAIHWLTGLCAAWSREAQATTAPLSWEPGINVKTVAKWRKRETLEDRKTGPAETSSTVLSLSEEAMIVAFRRHTLLPVDDCLYALQPSIPHLTRSSLNRCLKRHGISRLPDMEGDKPKRQKFKRCHIQISLRFFNMVTSFPRLGQLLISYKYIHDKTTKAVPIVNQCPLCISQRLGETSAAWRALWQCLPVLGSSG